MIIISIEGATQTAIWTQLGDAIKKDHGIELPRKAGEETTALIKEITRQIIKKEK